MFGFAAWGALIGGALGGLAIVISFFGALICMFGGLIGGALREQKNH
jgi:hypothetical protein